jgi:hypothetical protein
VLRNRVPGASRIQRGVPPGGRWLFARESIGPNEEADPNSMRQVNRCWLWRTQRVPGKRTPIGRQCSLQQLGRYLPQEGSGKSYGVPAMSRARECLASCRRRCRQGSRRCSQGQRIRLAGLWRGRRRRTVLKWRRLFYGWGLVPYCDRRYWSLCGYNRVSLGSDPRQGHSGRLRRLLGA